MSLTFQNVLALLSRGEVRISAHGYDELADDDILVKDVIAGVREAVILEDYPEYPNLKGLVFLYYRKTAKEIQFMLSGA